MKLVLDPNLVGAPVYRRVPGGYLNRWLVREVWLPPLAGALFINGVCYMHPATWASLDPATRALFTP